MSNKHTKYNHMDKLLIESFRKKSLTVIHKDYGKIDPLFEDKNYLSKIDSINEQIMFEHRLLVAKGQDLNSRLIEGITRDLQEKYNLTDEQVALLREGFWDAVQFGVGSLAGGVDDFLRKTGIKKLPKDRQAMYDIFKVRIEKEGNKAVQELISTVDDEINDIEAGLDGGGKFPVNKNRTAFLTGVNSIAAFYDSIVEATKKDPGEDGHMMPEIANEIIEQLRIYTEKLIADTETFKGGVYKLFGGRGELGGKGFTKEKGIAKKGEFIEGELSEQEGGDEKKGEEKEEEVKIVIDEEVEKLMRGKASPIVATLGSMKAPIVLAGIGAALGALAWLSQTRFMADMVKEIIGEADSVTMETDTTILETQTETINSQIESTIEDLVPSDSVKPGDGLYRFIDRAYDGPKINTVGDWKDALMDIGGGDLDKGIEQVSAVGRNPGAASEAFTEMLSGNNALSDDSSVWKIFKAGTKTSGGLGAAAGRAGTFAIHPKGQLLKVIKEKIWTGITTTTSKQVPRKIIKKVSMESAKGVAAAGAVAAMGPILAGLGVGFVGAGVTLGLLRARSKKASRTATLGVLKDALDLVDKPPAEIPPDQEGIEIEITLYNESFSNMLRNNSMILNERTEIFVKGLSGSEEIEAAGGEYRFTLDYIAPMKLKGDTLDIFPKLKTKLDDQLEEVDLDDPNTKITIIDKRKEKEKEEELEEPEKEKKKKRKRIEKVKTSNLAKIPSYKGLDMGTLKKMAKARGIKGYGKMKKDDLIVKLKKIRKAKGEQATALQIKKRTKRVKRDPGTTWKRKGQEKGRGVERILRGKVWGAKPKGTKTGIKKIRYFKSKEAAEKYSMREWFDAIIALDYAKKNLIEQKKHYKNFIKLLESKIA